MRTESTKTEIVPLTEEWIEFIRQVRNDPKVNAWLASPSMLISAEDQEQWFDWYPSQGDVRRFIALVKGKPVGYGLIKSIDQVHRSAEVGLCIASEHWRKGYGRHLLEWLVELVLVTLNLHRCWLDTFADNEGAVRLYEAVGFKREGLLRENRLKDGCYRNSLIMSILDCWVK